MCFRRQKVLLQIEVHTAHHGIIIIFIIICQGGNNLCKNFIVRLILHFAGQPGFNYGQCEQPRAKQPSCCGGTGASPHPL